MNLQETQSSKTDALSVNERQKLDTLDHVQSLYCRTSLRLAEAIQEEIRLRTSIQSLVQYTLGHQDDKGDLERVLKQVEELNKNITHAKREIGLMCQEIRNADEENSGPRRSHSLPPSFSPKIEIPRQSWTQEADQSASSARVDIKNSGSSESVTDILAGTPTTQYDSLTKDTEARKSLGTTENTVENSIDPLVHGSYSDRLSEIQLNAKTHIDVPVYSSEPSDRTLFKQRDHTSDLLPHNDVDKDRPGQGLIASTANEKMKHSSPESDQTVSVQRRTSKGQTFSKSITDPVEKPRFVLMSLHNMSSDHVADIRFDSRYFGQCSPFKRRTLKATAPSTKTPRVRVNSQRNSTGVQKSQRCTVQSKVLGMSAGLFSKQTPHKF